MNLDLRYKGATRSVGINSARPGSVSDVIDRYRLPVNECDLDVETISQEIPGRIARTSVPRAPHT